MTSNFVNVNIQADTYKANCDKVLQHYKVEREKVDEVARRDIDTKICFMEDSFYYDHQPRLFQPMPEERLEALERVLPLFERSLDTPGLRDLNRVDMFVFMGLGPSEIPIDPVLLNL